MPCSNVTQQVDIADWDDWDYTGAPTSIIVEPSDPHIGQGAPKFGPAGGGAPTDNGELPEMDYFSDMAPTLKKTVS